MVGVSRKKGGCATCRTRKVKCDGKTPCGPCSIKDRECVPYERDFLFIQEGVPSRSVAKSSHFRAPYANNRLRWQSWQSTTSIAKSISSDNANIDQLLSHFIEDYLMPVRGDSDVSDISAYMWVTRLPALRGTGPGIDSGILAMTSAVLGRNRPDRNLLNNAVGAYGKTLRFLQRDLLDDQRLREDQTLATSVALITYQFTAEKVSLEDYTSHVKGSAGIISAVGPEAYTHGNAQELFFSCRPRIILDALSEGRMCFLGEERWMTLPWTSTRKTEYQKLLDCMALLPNLVAEWYQMRTLLDPEERNYQRRILIGRTWELHARFESWYEAFSPDSADFTIVPTTFDSDFPMDCGRGCFPGSYRFKSLRTANLHMVYCGSMLVLYNFLNYAHDAMQGIEAKCVSFAPENPAALRCAECLANARSNTEPGYYACSCGWIQTQPTYSISELPPSLPHHSPDVMARRICMSWQYCIQQPRVIGSHFTLFGLKMAIDHFITNLPETRTELAWCFQVVGLLERSGLSFCKSMFAVYEGLRYGGFAV